MNYEKKYTVTCKTRRHSLGSLTMNQELLHEIRDSYWILAHHQAYVRRVCPGPSSAPTELSPSEKQPAASISASTQLHTSRVCPGPSSARAKLASSAELPAASTSALTEQHTHHVRPGTIRLLSISGIISQKQA